MFVESSIMCPSQGDFSIVDGMEINERNKILFVVQEGNCGWGDSRWKVTAKEYHTGWEGMYGMMRVHHTCHNLITTIDSRIMHSLSSHPLV